MVEFSVRVSGGHVYRNIRDVHGIDLVAVHALSVLDAEESTIEKYAKRNTKSRNVHVSNLFIVKELLKKIIVKVF